MLRDYQIEIREQGLKLLREYSIAYLAMEVRTGKTLTALSLAAVYGARRVLFFTRKKAISSIEDDFCKLEADYTLHITNYEQAHNLEFAPDLVILDEAHCLGAFPKPAEKVKVLRKLCKDLPIIYLSGSPTPESYAQIYHQLAVSSFSPFAGYANFYKWAADYVKVKQKRYGHGLVNDYSHADREKIDAACKHLFITYTQTEAGFTRMVQEQVLLVRMQPQTYALAEQLRKHGVFESKKSGKVVLADSGVKLMQKLHQVYSGSVITEDGAGQVFDMSKASFIREHFAGKKIAIFYKFKAEQVMLYATFGYSNITESPEEFNRSERLVFISQIQSGREGINLSTADCLVMLNIDFSHVSYLQARARMQTRDRVKVAELYWVFAEGGIEQKIYERVQAKQDYQLAHFRKDFVPNEKKQVA